MEYTGKKNSEGKGHGQGTETFADGTMYSGQWKGGETNGQGTATSADGTTYSGGF